MTRTVLQALLLALCYCAEECPQTSVLEDDFDSWLQGLGLGPQPLGAFSNQARCLAECELGASDDDRAFAKKLQKRSTLTDLLTPDEVLSWICMNSCLEGKKQLSQNKKPPQVFRTYFSAARQCSRNAVPLTAGELTASGLDRLYSCGVLHLEAGALFGQGLLNELHHAYNEGLRGNGARRLDAGHLRSGYTEWWPPAEAPFTDPALICPPLLFKLLQSYLGRDFVLDSMSVVSNTNKTQVLHADVPRARRHVEVHIALVNVTEAMGCTRFCPGTQALPSLSYRLQSQHWCHDEGLVYAVPSLAGATTLYDSNVIHGGDANRAGIPRPMLMLSFGSDPDAVDSRSYHNGWFAHDPDMIGDMEEDVTNIRAEFLKLRGQSE